MHHCNAEARAALFQKKHGNTSSLKQRLNMVEENFMERS
jgi:hypothetical protein